jgi:hypothetical protein
MTKFPLLFACLCIAFSGTGQAFEKYKLSATEMPEGYKASEKMFCQSVQPKLFYDRPELYQAIIGTVKSKDFQSFESKDDRGTVLFFEFNENVKGEGFLEGLLWGEANRPTKEHPEEYRIKDNILIIWSFTKRSVIKNLSRQKINTLP